MWRGVVPIRTYGFARTRLSQIGFQFHAFFFCERLLRNWRAQNPNPMKRFLYRSVTVLAVMVLPADISSEAFGARMEYRTPLAANETLRLPQNGHRAELPASAGKRKARIVFSQPAVNFDRTASSGSVTLRPIDLDYTAESNASWCECSIFGNVVQIETEANPTGSDRSASILVSADGLSEKLHVNQSKYAAGDLYQAGEITGIVFLAEGLHGKIVSLDETQGQWSAENKLAGARSQDDGMENMKTIKAITGWNTLYPAFAWCEAKNRNGVTGWYLPAKNELQTLFDNKADINAGLTNNNGASLSDNSGYWSSTELYNGYAYYNHNGYDHNANPKTTYYSIRAIHAF